MKTAPVSSAKKGTNDRTRRDKQARKKRKSKEIIHAEELPSLPVTLGNLTAKV
jgi:hypothetical protein